MVGLVMCAANIDVTVAMGTQDCAVFGTVKLVKYSPYKPMRVTGTGFGDALPPEGAEVEFLVINDDSGEELVLTQEEYEQVEVSVLEQLCGSRSAPMHFDFSTEEL